MTNDYDAIIIGSGHNGLVCGSYLARAGKKVLVLERRNVIGGATVTEEFTPGFRASTFSYLFSALHPKVIKELELQKFGLEVIPSTDTFKPVDNNNFQILSGDIKRTQKSFARFSKKDAAIYPEFVAHIKEAGAILGRIMLETPIDPSRRDWKGMKETLNFLWRYRKIGDQFYRLYDFLTMSADDYLLRWFESSINRASLAYFASIGTFAGPKTPGSAYVILHDFMAEDFIGFGFVRGGMGAVSQAIAESGKHHGMEIKTDAEIEEVTVENGRATGVVTKTGEQYKAKVIASNASCKVLFQQLVASRHLPEEFLADIAAYRTFSAAFKFNIATNKIPQFTAFDKDVAGFEAPNYIHIGPDIEYMEQAYIEARAGTYSSKPFITAVIPTTVDDSLAPEGKHVINCFGGHAPCELKNASWEDERDKFTKTVLGVIDSYAPGFSDDIIDMQVLLPSDIERMINTPQGHIFHGELILDQLFFKRPVPHYADYRSPVLGLYQCGSSTHPGGAVTGMPGHNAAREILKDWKKT